MVPRPGSGPADSIRVPLAVIGLGAIGGSLARALRDDPAWSVTGCSSSDDDRAAASDAGIDVARSIAEAAVEAAGGVVMIAVPLDLIAGVASEVLRAAPDALVLHAGSLQRSEAMRLADPDRERVFGTHPLAGTHRAGFAGSRGDLFRGAHVSIESRLAGSGRERAVALWRAAGATRIEFRDARAHDALMAWVSHLPQLVASALASVLETTTSDAHVYGPGARDTTRLAQSSFELWRPILERAPSETLDALRAAREALESLERELRSADNPALEQRWKRARAWRADLERLKDSLEERLEPPGVESR